MNLNQASIDSCGFVCLQKRFEISRVGAWYALLMQEDRELSAASKVTNDMTIGYSQTFRVDDHT